MNTKARSCRVPLFLISAALLAAASLLAQTAAPAHALVLELDPAQTTAEITLPTTLHTVEGKFRCKRGTVHYDSASGNTTGEIVFDATSGITGNGSRDHKMHKDVIESQRFPEIAFHPDHAQGTLAPTGTSTLQVHGQFNIHGADHDITVPVELTLTPGHWTASAKFPVPYQQWGMKTPNVLFLHVSDTVEVHLHFAGTYAP